MSKPTKKIAGVTVPQELEGKDLLKFLVQNKNLLIAEKKSMIKEADGFPHLVQLSNKFFIDNEGKLIKAAADTQPTTGGPETVIVVINTTNWMDSHGDVHIPGIWNKSLKDNPIQTHLQEHQMAFDHVISDESKAYTQKMTWKELGLDITGVTEALIFATPLKGRNPFMEDQYRKGFVKNHSVGMRYVTLKLAVNEPEDEYYKEEYANWVQYAPLVANLADAEAQGFFWAVLEAKIIEGSAVVKGSNIITPTIGFKSVQPAAATEHNQPEDSTGMKEKHIDWERLSTVKFLN